MESFAFELFAAKAAFEAQPGGLFPERYATRSNTCCPFQLITSVGQLVKVEFCIVELYQRVTYSQFFSSIYTGTGLKPTSDFAVLEITEEPPVFEKAFPGIPVLPDSYSLDAS